MFSLSLAQRLALAGVLILLCGLIASWAAA
jgi:hypothetical protein